MNLAMSGYFVVWDYYRVLYFIEKLLKVKGNNASTTKRWIDFDFFITIQWIEVNESFENILRYLTAFNLLARLSGQIERRWPI